MACGKIKKILFILDGYPISGGRACVFARNLIVSLADMGVKCTVISPQIFSPYSLIKKIKYRQTDITPAGNQIIIYEPFYLHMSSRPSLLGLSMKNHTAAVRKVIDREKIEFDAVYGHFIYQCGLSAAKIGEEYNVPSFLGAGESDKLLPNSNRCRGAYQTGIKRYSWADLLDKLSGVVCVSEWTRHLLIQGGYIRKDANCRAFPNGVNRRLFYPGDKKEAREKMNIRYNDFVVCFVGGFNDNKGAERVVHALNLLGSSIRAIFIGRDGPKRPVYNNAIFIGQCDNTLIPFYLRASDCFVLPTKSEGCCNAILEALACGIPVISSDMPFNDGILDETNSIRVDPTNISDIARSIRYLKDNPEQLEKLAAGARACADRFDISSRAQKIYYFMESSRSDQNM